MPRPPGHEGRRLRVVCFAPYPSSAPSVFHRIWAYRAHLERNGIDLVVWSFMSERFYAIRRRFGAWSTILKILHFLLATLRLCTRVLRVWRFDAVIIHREVFPLGPPVFERCIARLRRNVTFDLDDAMWHPPSNEVFQRRLLLDPNRFGKIIAACARTTAGNEYIATFARRYHRNVLVMPTGYDDLAPQDGRPKVVNPVPVVVWIGNVGNACYVAELVPQLEAAFATTPFVLRLIGGHDIAEVRSERLDIERLQWRRDQEGEWLRTADVGIMPLFDKDFEQGKCAFKIVQYFSAGLPVVCSAIGMNNQVVVHGVNGLLARDTGDWVVHLVALLGKPDARRRMGEAGRQTYLQRFTRERIGDQWIEVLRSGGTASNGEAAAPGAQ
jgi:glycosyltransferase involved in cell wall biosynthesis